MNKDAATEKKNRRRANPKRRIIGERERMCVICRTLKGKSGLIRIVRQADGACAVDITGKAPGRGAYICRSPECVSAAKKGKSLYRALSPNEAKGKVFADAAFWDELTGLVQNNAESEEEGL